MSEPQEFWSTAVVEAMQFDGTNGAGVVSWVRMAGSGAHNDLDRVEVADMAVGLSTAMPGDWVVRFADDMFYAMNEIVFKALFGAGPGVVA